MSSLALNYNSIYNASRNAKTLADSAENYAKGLEKNVVNRISSLEGGTSSNTSSASYFTTKKIEALNKKKTSYLDYSDKLKNFVDDDQVGAKYIDSQVAKNLKSESKTFRDNNNMKINPVTQLFTWLCTGLSNSCDFASKIGEIFTSASNWFSDSLKSIKEWYRYEGGKYFVNIGKALLAIGIGVLTIIATIATGGIGLIAICAIVGASIAILDGSISLISNGVSLYKNNSDPAWALKISKYDKASTALRKIDFDSKLANTIAQSSASVLDITETVCTVVTLVKSITDLGKKLPALKNLIGDESKGLGKAFLSKTVRDNDRKAVVTVKSFFNGLKTIATDASYRKSIGSKFIGDMKYHFSLNTIKDTLRYEWKFGIKQTFKNLTSKADRKRYLSILKDGLFEETVKNFKSGKTSKVTKEITKLLKTAKTGLSDFGDYSAGKSGGLLSKENMANYFKSTYRYLDSSGDQVLTNIEKLQSITSQYKSVFSVKIKS